MFYSYNHFVLRLNELLAFQANNISLYHSRQYYSCLTHFRSIFLFMSPENIKNLWFSDVSKGYKKVTLTETGLFLVVFRNYCVLQSFCFESYWLEKEESAKSCGLGAKVGAWFTWVHGCVGCVGQFFTWVGWIKYFCVGPVFCVGLCLGQKILCVCNIFAWVNFFLCWSTFIY